MPSVKTVLWDADGVLQQVPGSWLELLGETLGDEESLALLDVLVPRAEAAARGDVAMSELLAAVLAERGHAGHDREVREVWGTIERLEETRELVAELRAAGHPCHLATNQDDLRAAYMRERMGYEELLDGAFYSCDLGVAKPEAAFWTRIASDLGLAPEQLVFVDDTLENVVAARALGLAAVHWHHRDGVPALRDALAVLGVEA